LRYGREFPAESKQPVAIEVTPGRADRHLTTFTVGQPGGNRPQCNDLTTTDAAFQDSMKLQAGSSSALSGLSRGVAQSHPSAVAVPQWSPTPLRAHRAGSGHLVG
jgi:hypothetical protein